MKIAYWDTEQQGSRPPLLGEVKGTPTIRLYVPKKKQGNSNVKKIVLDYQFERKAVDMKKYLDEKMPSFVEKVSGNSGLVKFQDKAERNELPQVLLFTSKAKTLGLTKYLSTEFRRRLLLAEVHPTKPNKEVMDKYGVKDLPAMVVIPAGKDEAAIVYDGDGFTKNKLQSFLSKYALKDKVFPAKKKKEEEEEQKEDAKKVEPEPPKEEKIKVGAQFEGEL